MKCRSCNNPIKTSSKFCSNCGKSTDRRRLSINKIWQDFSSSFFSWDSNFYRTFKDMINKPEIVIEDYISGSRSNYFKPFSFLIVYASIALLVNNLFPMQFLMDSFTSNLPVNYLAFTNNKIEEFAEFGFKYYNLYIVISIPFVALVSYFVFNKKGNNFSEHLVMQSYIQSICGYIIILFQLLLVNLMKTPIVVYMNFTFLLYIIYSAYVFKRYYKLSLKSILYFTLKFFLIGGFLAIILSIIIAVIGAVSGGAFN